MGVNFRSQKNGRAGGRRDRGADLDLAGAHTITVYLRGEEIGATRVDGEGPAAVRKFELLLRAVEILYRDFAESPHMIEIAFSDGTFQRFGTDAGGMVAPIAIDGGRN